MNKAVAMRAIWANENSKPQDFYGRIVDQYGHPVEGATAVGTVMRIRGMDVGEEKEAHITKSDQNGEFEFVGLHGWQLGVVVKKEGYEMGQGSGVYQAPNSRGDMSKKARAVFKMWKLKGAEPMIYKSIEAGLSCDGLPMTLDLLTGHRVLKGGDLTVSMTRKPLNIDRSKPFEWSMTLTVDDGGLVEISDPYPNEAPSQGYQSLITKDLHGGPPFFTGNKFDQFYYLMSRAGQVYARLKIHISADYQPPPARLEIEVYANPNGSRNLEYDPAKRIKP